MKKLSVFLGIMVLLFGGVRMAEAAPMYYTFQGVVTNVVNQTNSPYQIEIGDTLEFIYMVEIENQAWKIRNDGVITTWSDYPLEDFFETDKLSMSYITDEFFMGYYESGGFDVYTTETHYGHIFDYPGVNSDEIRFASGNDSFSNSISLPGYTVLSSLYVGLTGRFGENGYFRINNNQVVDIIDGDITLTSISEQNPLINPVPEPTTMLLLGSGLVGMIGFRMKFKK